MHDMITSPPKKKPDVLRPDIVEMRGSVVVKTTAMHGMTTPPPFCPAPAAIRSINSSIEIVPVITHFCMFGFCGKKTRGFLHARHGVLVKHGATDVWDL